MKKLIACIITKNEEKWIELSLSSIIKNIDKVVIVDENSTDNTIRVANALCLKHNKPLELLTFKRTASDNDGNHRSVYINYLKREHLGDWAFVLDADEIVKGDLQKVKDSLENYEKNGIDCLNIKMHHLIGDMGHEDTTLPEHWTMHRIFKITDKIFHPLTEHGFVQGIEKAVNLVDSIEVWHFANARHCFYWLDKHYNMESKSEIHSKDFQGWWYYSHLLGRYPKKEVDPNELPDIIKDKFFVLGNLDKWKPKGQVNVAHKKTSSFMAFEYCINYLAKNTLCQKASVLDVGAGTGFYVDAWRNQGYSVAGLDQKLTNDKVTLKGTMEEIPIWDNMFDIIWACHSFEHTNNPMKTLGEFYRVLKPGGLLLLVIPHYCDREVLGMDKEHKFVLTIAQMYKIMGINKFKMLETKMFKESEEEVTWSNLIIATPY